MEWKPNSPDIDQVIKSEFGYDVAASSSARPPFYTKGIVIRAEVAPERSVMFVAGYENGAIQMCELDGTYERVVAANRIGGLSITKDTVADYIMFFISHLTFGCGPLVIPADLTFNVDTNSHRIHSGRIRVGHQDSEGSIRVGAFMLQGDIIHRASFRVHAGGHIAMVKAKQVGTKVAIH